MAAIDPLMPAVLRRQAIAARHPRLRPQLIANSAVLLISTAGSVVICYTAANHSGIDDLTCALLAFLLFVLGVWLAILAFVAGRFPGAARVGMAIAGALRDD